MPTFIKLTLNGSKEKVRINVNRIKCYHYSTNYNCVVVDGLRVAETADEIDEILRERRFDVNNGGDYRAARII